MTVNGNTPSNTDQTPGEAAPLPEPPGREAAILAFLVLLALALALYQTSERDLFTAHEARAARVAVNMLRSGEWPADKPDPRIVPQISSEGSPGLNYHKPPLYYWAVALVSLPGGEVTTLTVRLPSAVSFIFLVVIVYYLGKALMSVRCGFIAAMVLLSTPKMLWWGRAAVLDPMLAACVAGALLFFFRAHRGLGGRWQYWLFWALVGLGTLVKASALVIPPMTAGLYLLVRAREEGFWRPLWRLKPISGTLVLLAVAAPWHVLAHAATAGEFSRIYWGMHVFGRATGSSVFERSTSWWFYLPALVRDLFPWVIFLPGALVQPWRRASREHRDRTAFPYVWFVASLVFFSLVPYRKDEYMLVAYPGAALLVGYFFDYYLYAHREDPALRRWVVGAFIGVAVTALLAGGGLLAIALGPEVRHYLLSGFHNLTDRATFDAAADLMAGRPWLTMVLMGPVVAGAVAAAVLVRRGRPASAVALMACTTILAFILFVMMIVPVMGQARGLAAFADDVRREAARRGRGTRVFLAVEECHELAFLLRPSTVGLDSHPSDFLDFLKTGLARGERWLVIMEREPYAKGRWSAPSLAWRPLRETEPPHRRPMVLLEPKLTGQPPSEGRRE